MAFRGYAQQRLAAIVGKPWLAICLSGVAFGLQHTLFAFSVPGMLTFGLSFLCWGLISGWIYQRQQRLVPLITAHFITNAVFGAAIPIALVLAG
jgi:membrane protease YdiL (CAAX protease family)